jgi:putative endonuclease
MTKKNYLKFAQNLIVCGIFYEEDALIGYKKLKIIKNLYFVCIETSFMFTTYVLYSQKFDKIYIGHTADLITRFYFHNELAIKGYTIKYRPWIVVYVEFFDTRSQAMKREKELKSSRGRNYIREKVLVQYI